MISLFASLTISIGLLLATENAVAMETSTVLTSYLETTGSRQKSFHMILQRTPQLTLNYQDEQETCTTSFDSDLATRYWTLESVDQLTRIEAVRSGETLSIYGTLAGQPFKRTHTLGKLPWFQALSVSLGSLVKSPKGQRQFWILHPETLALHRMQVSEVRETDLDFQKEKIPTWQLTIRPDGWQSFLWHAHYWLRRSDLRFLKYEGASGQPGAPPTLIILASEKSIAGQAEP